MTVQECIDRVDAVKPNAFSADTKAIWIGEIEGRIANEIFLMAPCALRKFAFSDAELDGDKGLLVDPPYDNIYTAYLAAKVDGKNGEFNKMSTMAQAFNRLWNEFSAYIANTYDPAAGYYMDPARCREEE